MNLAAVLNALEGVEHGLAELYGWLAQLFDHDAAASGMFFRLSLQEQSHVNLLRYGRSLVRHSPKEFRAVPVDRALIEELVTRIHAFRSTQPGPTLEEAVVFAFRAESHAAERIHRAVLVDASPSLAGVVASLACADREHAALLEAFAQQRRIALER